MPVYKIKPHDRGDKLKVVHRNMPLPFVQDQEEPEPIHDIQTGSGDDTEYEKAPKVPATCIKAKLNRQTRALQYLQETASVKSKCPTGWLGL